MFISTFNYVYCLFNSVLYKTEFSFFLHSQFSLFPFTIYFFISIFLVFLYILSKLQSSLILFTIILLFFFSSSLLAKGEIPYYNISSFFSSLISLQFFSFLYFPKMFVHVSQCKDDSTSSINSSSTTTLPPFPGCST